MPQVVVIDPAESATLQSQSLDLSERAKLIRTIENAQQFEAAAEMRSLVRDAMKQIKSKVDPVCAQTNAAHKAATGLRSELLEPLEIVDRKIGVVMDGYVRERDRQARIEQQAAQEAAAKAIAETRIERAVDLEAQGRTAEADRLLATPILPVVAASPVPVVPKVSGFRTRTEWKYEVTDAALIAREYLMIDEKKIAGLVKVVGEDAVKLVGGIRVYQETDVIGAGGRIG